MALKIEHKTVGDVVEIPKEEFERLQDTIEFLENKALQKGIMTSIEQYKKGQSKPWREVRKNL